MLAVIEWKNLVIGPVTQISARIHALALAFGLGGKDAAAKHLEELKQKRSGK